MNGALARRRWWLRLHRWFALSVGWLLAIVALMGAVLVVARPLDQWANPRLFIADAVGATQAAGASLESIRQQLMRSFGPRTSLTFRPPRESGDTLWVLVRGEWTGTVYLHPVTGVEQGRRGDDEGFVNVLFRLHSSLWLKETGKAVLACVAIGYLLLLITGVVLWWPRGWPPSWRIELRRGRTRGLFDLHRVGGAAVGLMIAISVATGAYMAWRPIGDWISWLAGATPVKAPLLPTQVAADGAGAGGTASVPVASAAPVRPTLDQLVQRAQAEFPSEPIGYVQVPEQANRPVRVRMRLADDPHPNGITSVWLDPRDGNVLAVNRWNELDPGGRAVSVIYPLHTGELGGVATRIMVLINGVTLGGLGVTGVWLWWRRRAVRRAGA